MRIRWRDLELPTRVELDKSISCDTYGRLYIEPFERGFGITVGNSLRRILLSSLEGSAITDIKVKGMSHEFMSLPGIVEDGTDLILNVKSLVVDVDSDEPRIVKVSKKGPGVVTAADIEVDPVVMFIDEEQVLATISDDSTFEMEMTVQRGRGYVPASREEDDEEEREVGVIPIDALYSPVSRVRYKTEETRVGKSINYDRLIMDIWTDGSVTPELALVESAKILRKHLGAFVSYFSVGKDTTVPGEVVEVEEEVESDIDEELRAKLNAPIQELDLTVRSTNCLELAKIETIGELVIMHEGQLLGLRSFGKTSLREIRKKLEEMGLSLGMNV